jgi:hypothetical protein
MSRHNYLFAGLLVAAMAGAAWACYQAQARQVATLARISALESRLIISNEQREQVANGTLAGIERVICLRNNQPSDLLVLRSSERIRARTQSLLDTLRTLRRQAQPSNYGPAQTLRLAEQLDAYCISVKMPLILNRPSAVQMLRALQGPPASRAAALTYIGLLLRRVEAAALTQEAMKASNNYDGFDVIRPLAVPAATTVAPGAEYHAQLLLAWLGRATSCSMQPIAEVNGVSISARAGQPLPVSFRISAAKPGQPDTVRAQWQGLVRLRRYLADTVLQVAVPYLVVKRATL